MSLRKYLFVDRDGTLIVEPPDQQIDTLEKLALVEGVIPALLSLQAAGYVFVMVTNQDGLGSARYPRQAWDLVQKSLLQLFSSQGIEFADVLICPHFESDACLCRKPHLGLVRSYLTRPDFDSRASVVVGDRETDVRLAENMGLRGYRVGANQGMSWQAIARELLKQARTAEFKRGTKETEISVRLDLDGDGRYQIQTGNGYFDHMLEQLSRHSGIDITLQASGDWQVDEHHTVEDTALVLGEALRQALGDKVGIARYGFLLPMDEAEAKVSLDLGGRPFCQFLAKFPREEVGGLPTELVPHFFKSFCDAAGLTMHIEVSGENAHHMVEATFKSVARALRMAIGRGQNGGLPSTKGVL